MKVLLDYDDVLADTERHALARACELLNDTFFKDSPISTTDFRQKYPGKTFRAIVTEISVERGLSLAGDQIERLVREERQAVIAELRTKAKASEGANEALTTLKQGDFDLAVVSSSALERLQACMEVTGQSSFFDNDRIFSAEDSLSPPVSKPKPDIYLHAIQRLGVAAAECIAIEDSKNGVTAAAGAGITNIVGYVGLVAPEKRHQHALDLFDRGALLVIENFSEFPDVVQALSNGRANTLEAIYGRGFWLTKE